MVIVIAKTSLKYNRLLKELETLTFAGLNHKLL